MRAIAAGPTVRTRVVTGVVVAAFLSACTTTSHNPITSSHASSSGSTQSSARVAPDVVISFRMATVGPSGWMPQDAARTADAVACLSYLPGPQSPAGPNWEIHLRVTAAHQAASLGAVRKLQGVRNLVTIPLSAFADAPLAAAGGRAEAFPC
jgi:hypothetical protein